MKKESFSKFDAADYLESEADIAAYLEAASDEGDPRMLMTAIGDVIRARNVAKVARDSGISREGLYKAFSDAGNPSFSTVVKVAKALDLEVSFRARRPAKASVGASRSRKVRVKAHPQAAKSDRGALKR